MTTEERLSSGVTDNLIHVLAGTENVDEIITDLLRSLRALDAVGGMDGWGAGRRRRGGSHIRDYRNRKFDVLKKKKANRVLSKGRTGRHAYGIETAS